MSDIQTNCFVTAYSWFHFNKNMDVLIHLLLYHVYAKSTDTRVLIIALPSYTKFSHYCYVLYGA